MGFKEVLQSKKLLAWEGELGINLAFCLLVRLVRGGCSGQLFILEGGRRHDHKPFFTVFDLLPNSEEPVQRSVFGREPLNSVPKLLLDFLPQLVKLAGWYSVGGKLKECILYKRKPSGNNENNRQTIFRVVPLEKVKESLL
jgi:hypothetical protein